MEKFKIIFFPLFLIGIAGLTIFPAVAFGLELKPASIIVVEIDAEIRAGTVQFVKRGLQKAEKENSRLFVIEINTPGGLLKATEEITRLLLDSKVPSAVFVHKKGGWAFSAGAYILLSAEIAAAHPESSIGAAQPRFLGMNEIVKPDEKIIEASASWIKRLAETRKRNAEVAESFVRKNISISGKEAFDLRIVDFVAADLEDFLFQLNLEEVEVIKIEETLLEKIFSFLSIPQVVSLFLTIGVLGLIFTFKTGEPGIGVIAALAFLAGLWGIGAISISILGAALLIFGITLLVVEFFTPEFGVFGAVGGLAFVAGVLLFAEEPFRQSIFLDAITYFIIGIGIGFVVLFSVAVRLIAKTLRIKPQIGLEALIGKEGLVIDKLAPYGRITVDGQNWRAKCEKFREKEDVIEAGSRVKITGFSGNTLLTQKVEEK